MEVVVVVSYSAFILSVEANIFEMQLQSAKLDGIQVDASQRKCLELSARGNKSARVAFPVS